MRADKHNSNKPAAAIVMCFCLMALVSFFVVKASVDKVKDSMETADVVKKQAVDEIEKEVPEIVDSRENDVERGFDDPESDVDRDNGDAAKAPADYMFPVEGNIIMEYSMDMPIYWKTLDQYMVHGGIDIASEAGTPVQACAGGTVTKIEKDDGMGVTVEINHGNDLISVYSNLATDGLIELGEVITQGTVIGKVGQSAMFEFESPDHLHFEMKKNGEHVDPSDYLTK